MSDNKSDWEKYCLPCDNFHTTMLYSIMFVPPQQISPKSDNKCMKYGCKFVYAPMYNVPSIK